MLKRGVVGNKRSTNVSDQTLARSPATGRVQPVAGDGANECTNETVSTHEPLKSILLRGPRLATLAGTTDIDRHAERFGHCRLGKQGLVRIGG